MFRKINTRWLVKPCLFFIFQCDFFFFKLTQRNSLQGSKTCAIVRDAIPPYTEQKSERLQPKADTIFLSFFFLFLFQFVFFVFFHFILGIPQNTFFAFNCFFVFCPFLFRGFWIFFFLQFSDGLVVVPNLIASFFFYFCVQTVFQHRVNWSEDNNKKKVLCSINISGREKQNINKMRVGGDERVSQDWRHRPGQIRQDLTVAAIYTIQFRYCIYTVRRLVISTGCI